MALSAITTRAHILCYYSYHHDQLSKPKKMRLNGSRNILSNARPKGSFGVRASNSRSEDESSTTNDNNGVSQDLDYIWKLGVGSVAGAAVIKYGSILFPEITRPNILVALIMISTPVIVAIVLLINQSRQE
ncbi:hypothetical protein Tsubulata_013018 [Turnera subulata]|uniref:Uncharacterized protein n=1 Tax=Turnera subulata TaxID=218843 RepID=A0A9Q0JLX1_9ROSI|nr:hypothetical protein Tsubulata_013018 [Turnera subulata]